MVENIEELCPELRVHALAQMPVLGHGKIEVAEAGVAEKIAPHISQLT